MIATTHNGDSVWILLAEPNWGRRVELTAEVVTESTRSLTGRQFRSPLGASLRCTLKWSSILSRAEYGVLRNALRTAQDEPVIVPAWPFVTRGADWPGPVRGGIVVAWSIGHDPWEIDPGTPSGWDYVAPGLRGRLEIDLPSIITADAVAVDFLLTEDGSAQWGLAPGSVGWTSGPALNDTTTPPVFPFQADFSIDPRGLSPRVEVTRKRIGKPSRTRPTAFYPQSPALPSEAMVTMTSAAEVAKLMRWWVDRSGPVGAHYVTTYAEAATLAADADSGDTTLAVTDGDELGPFRYFALHSGDGFRIVRSSGISGETITLTAALSADVIADRTLLAIAILARHTGERLELSFGHTDFAQARLAWEEVTEEYAISAGETRGTTIGAGSAMAYLYEVTVTRATGSPTVYRYTSYEQDIEIDSDTWTATALSHSEITSSVRLDRDEVTFEGRTADWCLEFLPGRLHGRVTIAISECDVSGSTGSNVAAVWFGEVTRLSFDGPFIRASASGPYTSFDRPIPRMVIAQGCNHSVFDSMCGLSLGSWMFSANHVSATGNQVTLGSWSRSGGLPTGWGFLNYFALGYLNRGTDSFRILSSTAVSGGQVTITLDRSTTWSSGEAVSVVPGCDGRRETCKAYNASTNPQGKFNNYNQFGGFPFVPSSNPSFTPPKRTDATVGKK